MVRPVSFHDESSSFFLNKCFLNYNSVKYWDFFTSSDINGKTFLIWSVVFNNNVMKFYIKKGLISIVIILKPYILWSWVNF